MAWNLFLLCTGLRALGSIMIIVVLAVVGLTYYALVWTTYGPGLLSGGYHTLVALLVLLPFHFLLGMLLWCYFATVFTDPGAVPPGWRPYIEEDELEAQLRPPADSKAAGGGGAPEVPPDPSQPLVGGTVGCPPPPAAPLALPPSAQAASLQPATRFRRCRKCGQFKPPRTHHCSVCGRCVLKMDHHCVWVVNCVGAKNYKSFLLFLVYTFLATALAASALLPKFVTFFRDRPEDAGVGDLAATFLAFVLCLSFALSLLGFLLMHASLVAVNTSTIEAYETRPTGRWRYDLGRQRNFEQVFGHDRWRWLLPLYSPEDLRRVKALHGLEYPTRDDEFEDAEFRQMVVPRGAP